MMDQPDKLLEVRNLSTSFLTPEGRVPAVDNVSFDIGKGETLALVGESGCGKTVASLSIIRLLAPTAQITAEKMSLEGQDLLSLPPDQIRALRGKSISMIFQEPMTSLNPVYKISKQLGEVFTTHFGMNPQQVHQASINILTKVGIPNPKENLQSYPHQLSGGLRQRVMIAIALASAPQLVIADEPTTALDVTIQAQIMELLKLMQKEIGMSILLITHDFGVVSELADRVAVMYAGKIVEEGPFAEVFERPLHPYTRALIDSIPGMRIQRGSRLESIKGMVPNPLRFPNGCRFHPRCPDATEECRLADPADVVIGDRRVACLKREVWQ